MGKKHVAAIIIVAFTVSFGAALAVVFLLRPVGLPPPTQEQVVQTALEAWRKGVQETERLKGERFEKAMLDAGWEHVGNSAW